jgi:hypothetical protein
MDYGFRITKRRGVLDNLLYADWDGDYREIPLEDSVTEVRAVVSLSKNLSDVFDKGPYFLAEVGVLLCTWLGVFLFLGFVDERRDEWVSAEQQARLPRETQ